MRVRDIAMPVRRRPFAVNLLSYIREPRIIPLDVATLPCLSKGNDSDVYRIGDLVAKEYRSLSFDTVAWYSALQNEALELLRSRPYKAEIAIRGRSHLVSASEAVQVLEIARSAGGRPLALCRYVEHPNLEKLLWPPERFKRYLKEELKDAGLRRFASAMNDFFWSEYPTRAQDELHYHVCMLSRRLDRELGLSGCYISKYNVKLNPVADDHIELVVTDLALYIDRLEEVGSRE
jgi:hypothetical protein